ncbi:MAG: LapA family protein [Firmicutes bacterium]|nr:LapA family protein [Bacillota bacterium]
METLLLIVALVVSLLIALLALANKETVAISYLIGEARVSLIVLILASACAGAIITGLFSLVRSARSALRFRELRRQLGELKQRLSGLEQENVLLAEKLEQDREQEQEQEQDREQDRTQDRNQGRGRGLSINDL